MSLLLAANDTRWTEAGEQFPASDTQPGLEGMAATSASAGSRGCDREHQPATLAERLQRTVTTPRGCWIWSGPKLRDRDYARVRYRGRDISVRRAAWEVAHGAVPEGRFVINICGHGLCINPDHLRVTERMNLGNRNGARLHPECLARGERNGNSRLTTSQVAEIRRRRQADAVSLRKLARSYGISYETVRQVIRGRTWALQEGR